MVARAEPTASEVIGASGSVLPRSSRLAQWRARPRKSFVQCVRRGGVLAAQIDAFRGFLPVYVVRPRSAWMPEIADLRPALLKHNRSKEARAMNDEIPWPNIVFEGPPREREACRHFAEELLRDKLAKVARREIAFPGRVGEALLPPQTQSRHGAHTLLPLLVGLLWTLAAGVGGATPAFAQTFLTFHCGDGTQFVAAFREGTRSAYVQLDGKAITLPRRLSLSGTRYSAGSTTLRIKQNTTTLSRGRQSTECSSN